MSHANGLSPFRGKVNRFIIPVGHFNGRTLVTSTLQKTVVAEPPPDYVPKKKAQQQPTKTLQEKTEHFSPPKIKIKKKSLQMSARFLPITIIY